MSVATEGKMVLQIHEGLVVLNVPALQLMLDPETVIRLGKQLIKLGTQINNLKTPEQLIEDEAILRRKGVRISLAGGNKDIQKAASTSAQWDKNLRRMKASVDPVKSQEYVHPPRIIMEKS